MALGVGDRLLHDPVDGGGEVGRQVGGDVGEVQPDGEAQIGAPLRQVLELVECGEGSEGPVCPERSHQSAHRSERLGAGRLDLRHRRPRRRRSVVPHRLRRLRLHDDAGDVVGNDVVQLPGDGDALVLAGLVVSAAFTATYGLDLIVLF